MWKDFIMLLKHGLETWMGVHLNLAGRVCLINSVLNNIPIYSLSFYKESSSVIKQIREIQRKFLWNGTDLKRSYNWVHWDVVCKPRDDGGLEVKCLEVMNATLLSKWKWRILTEEEAVWRGVLEARYGNMKKKMLISDVSVVGKKKLNLLEGHSCF